MEDTEIFHKIYTKDELPKDGTGGIICQVCELDDEGEPYNQKIEELSFYNGKFYKICDYEIVLWWFKKIKINEC